MNRESNIYTIIYASIMVVVAAVLLALTSQLLKSFQKENEENDKRQQILRSINVAVTAKEAKEEYGKLIKDQFFVNEKGEKIEGDAFGEDVANSFRRNAYPVFIAEVDGQTKYVMALSGAGLWGPIWGYISVNDDRNTVFGADFGHTAETPGLGAEIVLPDFRNKFKGKEIFKDGTFKSIAIVKHGKSVQNQDYVDGISGGTITSQAVGNMLFESLKEYEKFLTSQKQ